MQCVATSFLSCVVVTNLLTGTFLSFWILNLSRILGSPKMSRHRKQCVATSFLSCVVVANLLTGTFLSFWILNLSRILGSPKISRHPKNKFMRIKTPKLMENDPKRRRVHVHHNMVRYIPQDKVSSFQQW